ncbi:YncE family protein [Nonomuraea sp. NEAU-A123]|uniref:YncE family protein n=1 Tax=Nonomuraea sp. NEAU-A123 TaxID=2839649 RepID=UPI002032E0AC|nr:beta-propeller fold lactonase family protein [Nonomuraea sp. NEAU-A123]
MLTRLIRHAVVAVVIAAGLTPTSVAMPATAVAAAPLREFAYVANFWSDTVSVINIATNTITGTIRVGNRPEDVAITPDGGHAYVANRGSDSVTVIDTATNTVTDTIRVGDAPTGVAIGRL